MFGKQHGQSTLGHGERCRDGVELGREGPMLWLKRRMRTNNGGPCASGQGVWIAPYRPLGAINEKRHITHVLSYNHLGILVRRLCKRCPEVKFQR